MDDANSKDHENNDPKPEDNGYSGDNNPFIKPYSGSGTEPYEFIEPNDILGSIKKTYKRLHEAGGEIRPGTFTYYASFFDREDMNGERLLPTAFSDQDLNDPRSLPSIRFHHAIPKDVVYRIPNESYTLNIHEAFPQARADDEFTEQIRQAIREHMEKSLESMMFQHVPGVGSGYVNFDPASFQRRPIRIIRWTRRLNETLWQWGNRLFQDNQFDDPDVRWEYQKSVWNMNRLQSLVSLHRTHPFFFVISLFILSFVIVIVTVFQWHWDPLLMACIALGVAGAAALSSNISNNRSQSSESSKEKPHGQTEEHQKTSEGQSASADQKDQ